MGRLLLSQLEQLPELGMLYVCDITFEEDRKEEGQEYFRSIERAKDLPIDVAFIAATACAHFGLIKTLIGFGIKNIFVEKPAVLSIEEYNQIMAISKDCRIATGYILRHADSINALKSLLEETKGEGFRMESCKVNYEKYLPVTAEARAMTDLGIFDEMPHIWDLLFNYFDFKAADISLCSSEVQYEEEKKDRAVVGTFVYDLSISEDKTVVNIHSSFLSSERKRRFEFVYVKGDERRIIAVDLDSPENKDYLTIEGGEGNILLSNEYPSLTKVRNEVNAAMEYFLTSSNPHIALFNTENVVLNLYNEVK